MDQQHPPEAIDEPLNENEDTTPPPPLAIDEEAIRAHNEYVERHGIPLSQYRKF
jgi:hypothetical protein